ncbi:MAG: hypothetical protein WDN31_03995, partial [Hyphomicrobium sp.]
MRDTTRSRPDESVEVFESEVLSISSAERGTYGIFELVEAAEPPFGAIAYGAREMRKRRAWCALRKPSPSSEPPDSASN